MQTDTHLLSPCFELARQAGFFLVRFQLAVSWPSHMAPRLGLLHSQPAQDVQKRLV